MLLEATGLDKQFNGVYALKQMGLSLKAGEIHGLVGENGAGKSTLIKILGGVYGADSGEICWEGKPLSGRLEAAQSRALGIRILYQENMLVPAFSGVENIWLGRPYPTKNGRILWDVMRQEAETKAAELGIEVNLQAPVMELRPPQKKCVEILRAILGECRLLILDEPTASLSDRETAMLFDVMKRLAAKGTAILYVSHRLEEVLSLTHRITVLRNGETAAVLDTKDATKELLIGHMSGMLTRQPEREPKRQEEGGRNTAKETCRREARPLEVRALSSRDGIVKNVSLTAPAGQITGIFGLCGSGRTELLECIYGCRRIKSGEVVLNGRGIKKSSPSKAVENGMAFICEDRRGKALINGGSLFDNMVLASIGRFSRRGRFLTGEAAAAAEKMQEFLKIKCMGLSQPVEELSGGNQQKAVFARALLTEPSVWLCDEPTQAVDVASRKEIHRLLQAEAKKGCAVVFVSSDLTEILEIADEVAVMAAGTIVARLKNSRLSPKEVLALCYGTEEGRKAV